jgi:radical SAM superfamily enzyme YgiQ (UPF0313 family)
VICWIISALASRSGQARPDDRHAAVSGCLEGDMEARMLSIALVVPSWHYWIDPLKLQPMWELYYATWLRERFPDAAVDIVDLREPDRHIPERDIYVYWVNKSADAFEVYEIIRTIKGLYPRSVHIGGGTHVDHMTDQSAGHFDTVLLGTAEEAMAEAIQDETAGRRERLYRTTTKCHFASYPMIRRDFLPAHRIVNDKHFVKYGGVPGTGVYFSRGCGFRCRFCVYNNPPKFELRAPEQITEEIDYLKREYGVQGVNLRDEVCIPVNKKEATGYLEAIGKAGVIWRGQTVPLASEEMIRLAAQTGLKEVALGLESVDSDEVLRISNKPSQSIEDNKRYIALLQKHGIKVKVCLIFGLPGESRHVLERTIRFLDEVRPDFVAVSGSPFFAEPKKYGIKFIDPDLSRHAHLLYRFGDEEEVGLPFEYEEEAPWGKPLSRQEITQNIRHIQQHLRERGMSY